MKKQKIEGGVFHSHPGTCPPDYGEWHHASEWLNCLSCLHNNFSLFTIRARQGYLPKASELTDR